MKTDYDKLYFEALQTLSKDRTPGSVGQTFSACKNALQELYDSLSEEQTSIISHYMIALDKLHEAAFSFALNKKENDFPRVRFRKLFFKNLQGV